jgi:hypothetical protein
MSAPVRKLTAAADLARAMSVGWPAYEAVEAMLAIPTMRSAGGAGTTGGDVSRPVEAQALSHQHYDETVALVDEALGLLRMVQTRMARINRQQPELARDLDAAAKALRCTGTVGDDPTCTRNAVRNITHRGTPEPTCWACIKRAQRGRTDNALDEAG